MEPEENQVLEECDFCGQVAVCFHGPDPYASEIHGDATEVTICDMCYQSHCEDI